MSYVVTYLKCVASARLTDVNITSRLSLHSIVAMASEVCCVTVDRIVRLCIYRDFGDQENLIPLSKREFPL